MPEVVQERDRWRRRRLEEIAEQVESLKPSIDAARRTPDLSQDPARAKAREEAVSQLENIVALLTAQEAMLRDDVLCSHPVQVEISRRVLEIMDGIRARLTSLFTPSEVAMMNADDDNVA